VGHEVVELHPTKLTGAVPEHLLQRRVCLEDAPGGGVDEVDPFRGLLDHGPVALLASPQGLLRPPTLGDVLQPTKGTRRIVVASFAVGPFEPSASQEARDECRDGGPGSDSRDPVPLHASSYCNGGTSGHRKA
jgi:hypothetical protein